MVQSRRTVLKLLGTLWLLLAGFLSETEAIKISFKQPPHVFAAESTETLSTYNTLTCKSGEFLIVEEGLTQCPDVYTVYNATTIIPTSGQAGLSSSNTTSGTLIAGLMGWKTDQVSQTVLTPDSVDGPCVVGGSFYNPATPAWTTLSTPFGITFQYGTTELVAGSLVCCKVLATGSMSQFSLLEANPWFPLSNLTFVQSTFISFAYNDACKAQLFHDLVTPTDYEVYVPEEQQSRKRGLPSTGGASIPFKRIDVTFSTLLNATQLLTITSAAARSWTTTAGFLRENSECGNYNSLTAPDHWVDLVQISPPTGYCLIAYRNTVRLSNLTSMTSDQISDDCLEYMGYVSIPDPTNDSGPRQIFLVSNTVSVQVPGLSNPGVGYASYGDPIYDYLCGCQQLPFTFATVNITDSEEYLDGFDIVGILPHMAVVNDRGVNSAIASLCLSVSDSMSVFPLGAPLPGSIPAITALNNITTYCDSSNLPDGCVITVMIPYSTCLTISVYSGVNSTSDDVLGTVQLPDSTDGPDLVNVILQMTTAGSYTWVSVFNTTNCIGSDLPASIAYSQADGNTYGLSCSSNIFLEPVTFTVTVNPNSTVTSTYLRSGATIRSSIISSNSLIMALMEGRSVIPPVINNPLYTSQQALIASINTLAKCSSTASLPCPIDLNLEGRDGGVLDNDYNDPNTHQQMTMSFEYQPRADGSGYNLVDINSANITTQFMTYMAHYGLSDDLNTFVFDTDNVPLLNIMGAQSNHHSFSCPTPISQYVRLTSPQATVNIYSSTTSLSNPTATFNISMGTIFAAIRQSMQLVNFNQQYPGPASGINGAGSNDITIPSTASGGGSGSGVNPNGGNQGGGGSRGWSRLVASSPMFPTFSSGGEFSTSNNTVNNTLMMEILDTILIDINIASLLSGPNQMVTDFYDALSIIDLVDAGQTFSPNFNDPTLGLDQDGCLSKPDLIDIVNLLLDTNLTSSRVAQFLNSWGFITIQGAGVNNSITEEVAVGFDSTTQDAQLQAAPTGSLFNFITKAIGLKCSDGFRICPSDVYTIVNYYNADVFVNNPKTFLSVDLCSAPAQFFDAPVDITMLVASNRTLALTYLAGATNTTFLSLLDQVIARVQTQYNVSTYLNYVDMNGVDWTFNQVNNLYAGNSMDEYLPPVGLAFVPATNMATTIKKNLNCATSRINTADDYTSGAANKVSLVHVCGQISTLGLSQTTEDYQVGSTGTTIVTQIAGSGASSSSSTPNSELLSQISDLRSMAVTAFAVAFATMGTMIVLSVLYCMFGR